MKGMQSRVVGLVALLCVASVIVLGAAPAMAATSITNYTGSADAYSLKLAVDPGVILTADLTKIRDIIKTLPLGLGQTLDGAVGDTLTNLTDPITVQANMVHSDGQAAKGTDLTTASSTSSPLQVQSAALAQELAVLRGALANVPAGAVAQIQTLLQPTLDALKGTALAATVSQVQTLLTDVSTTAACTLANPNINAEVLPVPLTANLPAGEDLNRSNVTIGPGLLTSKPFKFSGDEARAVKSDALATNNFNSIDLLPAPSLGLPALGDALTCLKDKLPTLISDMESTLTALTAAIGLPAVSALLNPILTNLGTTLTAVVATLSPWSPRRRQL